MTKIAIKNIDWKQPAIMTGDCRLGIFSKALLIPNIINISPEELFGFGCGLTFFTEEINLSNHLSLVGFTGRDINTELDFCIANNIDVKTIISKRPTIINNIDDDVMCELTQGRPIIANVDRYYLDYLEFEKAHFGWHTILLIGYDPQEKSLEVIDYVANGTKTISVETFNTAHFANLAFAPPEGRKFIIREQKAILNRLNLTDLNVALKRQAKKMLARNGGIHSLSLFLEFLLKLSKKALINKNARTYLKYQVELIYKTVCEQEYTKSMYRGLYLEFLKKCVALYSRRFINEEIINLLEYDVKLWTKLASPNISLISDDYVIQANAIAETISEIINVETRIFSDVLSY